MCRVYGSGDGVYTRLCYRTGRPGAHVPGDLLDGGRRRHAYGPTSPAPRTRLPVRCPRCACGAPMRRGASQCASCAWGR